MQEWPLKSTLDPAVYGPQESKITTELVEQQIKAYGYDTITEVLHAIKWILLSIYMNTDSNDRYVHWFSIFFS